MLSLDLIAAGHHLRDVGEADTLGLWGAQAGEKRRVEMVGVGCVGCDIGWHVDCVYAKFDFHPKVWYSAAR